MPKNLAQIKNLIILTVLIVLGVFGFLNIKDQLAQKTAHELNGVLPETNPENPLEEWKRPEGPPMVGLQIGHYKAAEAPEELKNLRSSTGTSGGGYSETEVNEIITNEVAKLLQEQGITVEILPTTVPPAFWADAFVTIHADGNEDPAVNGYKVAGPRRDWSKKSAKLVELLDKSYEQVGLVKDPNISRNMRGYYAFAWWRYEHAIHPMTTAAIVETGFLTNYSDRQVLINNPELPAKAIAEGILEFLKSEGLIS